VRSTHLERIYEYRFRDIEMAARRRVWAEIAEWLYYRFGAPERVLDPAAGSGEFIGQVPAPERWAVDMVDHGLTTLDGVKVQIAPIMDATLPDDYFDLIFASNLLEHLPTPDAVAEMLERLHAALQPGGRLVVMGPNFRYCAREYFDCADHVLPLTHVAVAEHLFGAGFTIEQVVPRFLPYSFRSVLPASATLTRRYLGTPLLWPVLGKQFLISGTKTAHP
jgi:SAM-dependent methyltransferase